MVKASLSVPAGRRLSKKDFQPAAHPPPAHSGRPRACLPAKIGALVIPFSKIVSAKPHHSFRIFRQSEPAACESINAPVRRRQPSFVIFKSLAFTTFTHQHKMSEKVETKTFGKGSRQVPHHSEKAQKWYPAESDAQPRKVRFAIARRP